MAIESYNDSVILSKKDGEQDQEMNDGGEMMLLQ